MDNFKITDALKYTLTGKKFNIKHSFSDGEIFIMFISSGKCKAVFNNKKYALNQGDFLVSTKSGALSYTFSDSHDAAFCFVRACCDNISLIENTFPLSTGVYHTFDARSVKITFAKIIKEFSIRASFSHIKLPVLFTELLCILSETYIAPSKAVQETTRLAEDIYKDYLGDIDISTYAQNALLSKDRLGVIFRNRFGYPPHKFQSMLKIKEATFLLTHTDLPIGKISDMLGFSSQLYFCNSFKAQTGLSPTQARNRGF